MTGNQMEIRIMRFDLIQLGTKHVAVLRGKTGDSRTFENLQSTLNRLLGLPLNNGFSIVDIST